MARNISFALTTPQFLDGSKDVTRRLGWEKLKAGDLLCAVKKGMGLKPGEKVERLGMIRVLSVRREPVHSIMLDDVTREGFPGWSRQQFIDFFCKSHRPCEPHWDITRIEFERIPDPSP